eukprot:1159126-Pelagomonas_calceolata.AAC.15
MVPKQHGADTRQHHQGGAGLGPNTTLYTTHGALTAWCRHAATPPRRGGPWSPHNMVLNAWCPNSMVQTRGNTTKEGRALAPTQHGAQCMVPSQHDADTRLRQQGRTGLGAQFKGLGACGVPAALFSAVH